MIKRFTYYLWSIYSKIKRITIASVYGFTLDDCFSKASALTYYTLLSIVPVLAVGFGIAKGFGFEQFLQSQFMLRFSDQPEIAEKLITFTYKTLDNTKSGLIAFIGLVFLFWSVLKLLSSIETSFNTIWKHAKLRTFSRRFSDYFTMMLFCPIFFIAASSLFVYVISEIIQASHNFKTVGNLDALFSTTVYLVPFIVSWLMFTAVYYIMPNTKVPLSAALIAGTIAGTIYQIVQWAYIRFQIEAGSYGAIYGSFAALPLFLIWINTSWIVALFGAEIAYHIENDLPITEKYGQKRRPIDQRTLGVLLIQQCMNAFTSGSPPPTIYELAKDLNTSIDSVRNVMQKFIDAGLIVNVQWHNQDIFRYSPAKSPSEITVKEICEALDPTKYQTYLVKDNENVNEVETLIKKMDGSHIQES